MLAPLFVALLVSAAQAPADLERFVERCARETVEREGVPGLSIAVALDGELLLARGFGWADEARGLPMQRGTRFPIGSLGRSLLGAAVLRAVERKQLALDAPLAALVPELAPASREATLRQILDGTSGLPRASELFPRLAARAVEGRLALREFGELVASLPPGGAPGERFESDSVAWLWVPPIVAGAARRPFANFVAEELTQPLGLIDTTLVDEAPGTLGHAQDCRELDAGRALEVWSGAEPREVCAHFSSTAADLVRWQSALFDRALLSESSTRLLTESVRTPAGEPLGQNACFELGRLGAEPSWRHVGGIGGWRGALSWYGNTRLSVCVLANCAGARVGELEDEIARFVLRLSPRVPRDLALEEGEAARCVGTYALGTTRVSIVLRGDKLAYQSPEEAFALRSQGFGRFLSADGEVLLSFRVRDGRASAFEETRKGSTSVAQRVE